VVARHLFGFIQGIRLLNRKLMKVSPTKLTFFATTLVLALQSALPKYGCNVAGFKPRRSRGLPIS
jgi:hypothetical protein